MEQALKIEMPRLKNGSGGRAFIPAETWENGKKKWEEKKQKNKTEMNFLVGGA